MSDIKGKPINKDFDIEKDTLYKEAERLNRIVKRQDRDILDYQQNIKELKVVLDDLELEIKALVLELLNITKQSYYWVTNEKFEEAKKKVIHVEVMGDNDTKYFIKELDKVGDKDES